MSARRSRSKDILIVRADRRERLIFRCMSPAVKITKRAA
jgi:hypothetical protein